MRRNRLAKIERVVMEQEEDEGLWSEAMTAKEAYLQQALRRLHKVIEDPDEDDIIFKKWSDPIL